MNILQVLPELNVGGVETGTVDLARYLVSAGHKAVVISNGGELVKDLEAAGVVHYCLPVHKKNLFTIFKMARMIAAVIRKEEIQVVHARSRVPAWPAYLASRFTKTVFITTCHGYYSRHLFSVVMGWGRRVIVLSNAIARHMIDDFKVPYERIRLIPRSVNMARFTFIDPMEKRKEEFNVGIIGRITPLKGHLIFIKAMAKAAKSIPRLKIWIIGDAPASKEAYKEQLQILVKRLGLLPYTQFLGTQRDIPGVLAHLDAVVLATTTQEAFGRVIIEAQAAGVPVVATKVGGVVDVIEDGHTGLLVPVSDPQNMADAVVRIYRDPELASRLACHAREKVVQKYTLERMAGATIEVYEHALRDHGILVVKLSSLGDVILTTAALRALREKFGPQYSISVLVGEDAKEVLLRCPYINELIVCDPARLSFFGILKLSARLRKKDFDIAVDLQNNRKSHLLARLSFAIDRYGYDNKKYGFLLNHAVKDDRGPLDPLTHQFRVLEAMGIPLKDTRLEMWPSEDDHRAVDELLLDQWIGPQQKLIGINVSASKRWGTKNWPQDRMARFCEEVAKRDMRVVLTGTRQDMEESLILMNGVSQSKPINACGKTTVNQLACLIKRCSCFVSTDSAPLHIAAAMETPFVALFGPTDPARHLPSAKKCVVINKKIPCSPCYKPTCTQKKRACMETITVDEVLEAVKTLV